MGDLKYLVLFLMFSCQVYAQSGKVLSFFNVVKFPNDVCEGNANRDGTCYTAEECEDRDGTASGACADGFGVCCVISIGCGASSSENNTFLVSATTVAAGECSYTICPVSDSVCRVRLDLTTFNIAAPAIPALTAAATTINSLGDCATDSFAIGGANICGLNTGQHIFVDTRGECVTGGFVFSDGGTAARSYDIRVRQYECGNDMAGPAGCLQYFTANTGTVASFNYPIGQVALVAASTILHLSNQNYDICFRANVGRCGICFTETIQTSTAAPATMGSFGLSITATADTVESIVEATATICTADFLRIPGGQVAVTANAAEFLTGNDLYCGRVLAPTSLATDSVSVCSYVKPFKIHFQTDGGEVTDGTGTDAMASELGGVASGGLGFSLDFVQAQTC